MSPDRVPFGTQPRLPIWYTIPHRTMVKSSTIQGIGCYLGCKPRLVRLHPAGPLYRAWEWKEKQNLRWCEAGSFTQAGSLNIHYLGQGWVLQTHGSTLPPQNNCSELEQWCNFEIWLCISSCEPMSGICFLLFFRLVSQSSQLSKLVLIMVDNGAPTGGHPLSRSDILKTDEQKRQYNIIEIQNNLCPKNSLIIFI